MSNQTFLPQVIMETPGNLIAAPFNPARRTEDETKLRALEDAIREAHGIIQPLIISRDRRVIDGHRRLQAAKNLGLKEIPCIIRPLSMQVGWRLLNATSMPVTSNDWAQAYYAGMSRENLPDKDRRNITEIERLLGREGFEQLAAKRMSPNVLQEARTVARYIENKSGREQPSDNMMKKVLQWMIQKNQQFAGRIAVRQRMNRGVLQYAVEKMLELASADRT